MTEIVFSCCFCGRILTDETAPDWIGVSIYDKDTGEPGQMWFAHEVCFRSKLHPDYDMSPSDTEPDWENAESDGLRHAFEEIGKALCGYDGGVVAFAPGAEVNCPACIAILGNAAREEGA